MNNRSWRPAPVHSFVLFEEGKDERQIEQMLRSAMRNNGPITISCKTRAIRRRVQRVADRIGLNL
jgi:hypothetical protein